MCTYALDHLDGEAHAVDLTAAILVVAHVGERRQELMDQIAVRHVQVENFEARFVGAPRPLSPAFDHFRDLRAGQRPWRRIGFGRIDGARGNQLPALPIPDVGAVLERRAALPWPEAPCLAAGVAELDAGHGIVLPDEVDAALQAGHVGIVPNPEIADRAAAAPLDLGRFHDHQARAAGGVAAGIHQVPVGGEALLRRILVHGRHDNPVLQGNVADGNRLEQFRSRHCIVLAQWHL